MMFHRLALRKILQLLKLDDLLTEDTVPTKSKQQKKHKTSLQVDQKMDIYVSILLSVISMLICLTIPIAALEKPCEIFKERHMDFLYAVASWMERHAALIERIIVALSLVLVWVSVKMIVDGILATNISISPWREQGKYNLPRGFRFK